VDITFSSYDTLTFTGKVVRIDPAMVTVNGSPTVQVWATFNPQQHPAKLLYGMDADVEVVAGQAQNALLVPVQALRQLGAGQYAVFVLQPNGELQMRPVQVGLRDAVNAQILSGVQAGEQVSIGGSGANQTGGARTNPAGGQGGANRAGQSRGQGAPNAGAGR
jgi:multidrug efflux pump subunit AcrA (membrane-fusion protein)